MDAQGLIPILLTAGLLYYLYENPLQCNSSSSSPSGSRSPPAGAYSSRIEVSLRLLLDTYYQRYLYPHAYPLVHFTIPSDRSMTVQRREVHLLIQDPYTREYFDERVVLAVGAHELAHVLCQVKEAEHGPLFRQVFERLNAIAIELGLFSKSTVVPERYLRLCA
jgi:hypothetical protein